jgi:hypothetical protein
MGVGFVSVTTLRVRSISVVVLDVGSPASTRSRLDVYLHILGTSRVLRVDTRLDAWRQVAKFMYSS